MTPGCARRLIQAGALVAVLLAAATDVEEAHADEGRDQSKGVAAAPPPDEAASDSDRALALGAAVFPGVLVHGSGSYVLGRSDTGATLFWLELGGVGLIGTGGAMLFLTGAARDLAGVAAAGTVAGVGLFAVSWMADIYSVVSPDGGWGRAAERAPLWEAEVGYRYVYDPRFEYRHFGVNSFSVWLGRWRLNPSLWAAPVDGNSRLRAVIAHRFLGPSRSSGSDDGSFLELQLAGTEHRFPPERFALSTAEWMLLGRLDLRRIGPHLEGSFAELGLGTGYQVTRFDLPGVESMGAALLLSRFAFGIYVGDQRSGGGEWCVYYDHRHDGYEAGLLMPGLGSGVAGHLGLEGYHYLDEHWGLGVEGSVGSAVVVGLSARFRHRGTP